MSTLMTSPSDPAAVWTDLDPDTDAPAGAAHLDRARHPAAISWTVLARRALQIASGLHAAGVRRGDRVSVILPPGPERTAVAYACWRLGAVVVATAPELTLRQEVQAHAAARPQVVVADSRGLLLTRALRSPRLRIATDRVPCSTSSRWARATTWPTWSPGVCSWRCRRHRPRTTTPRSCSPRRPANRSACTTRSPTWVACARSRRPRSAR
ncbi:AMP-binding protein [Cellulomonas soli]